MDNFEELINDLLTNKYTRIKFACGKNSDAPTSFKVEKTDGGEIVDTVHFQDGPIKENGVNGVMNEDVIVMVIARLAHFQQSEFKCRENAVAITKLEEALMWLRKRTTNREKRGVEGTMKI